MLPYKSLIRKIKSIIHNDHSVKIFDNDKNKNHTDIDGSGFSHDGVSLKVQIDHRSSLKSWWRYYGPFAALSGLDQRGLLSKETNGFLREAIGGKTLLRSLEEAREVLAPYLDRHGALFLTSNIPDLQKRPFRPSVDEIKRDIKAASTGHQRRIADLVSTGLMEKTHKPRVLEIGYTSGGISAFGWENSGCETHAIDYFFDSSVDPISPHSFIAESVGSKVNFHVGDITKNTGLPDDFFDLVYSTSTIEHIKDLSAAFAEMRRILKPGGIAYHSYDPYFHPGGGHSLGTLDSPWGHVRLPMAGIEQYIRELRPYEAPVALNWVRNALHPTHTQAHVQRAVVNAGLALRQWSTVPIAARWATQLNNEIVADAFRVIPGLTVQDLVTRRVQMIMQKESS